MADSKSTDPLASLYEATLGRTPSQAELDSWNFGETVDANELNRFLGAARNEAVETKPKTGAVGKIAQQILGQGTTGKWGGEGFGSAEKNAYDMAVMLAGQGLTDINQFGTREVEIPGQMVSNEEGRDYYTQPTTRKEFYNKATGQPINSYYDKAEGNIWGGTFAGKGSTSYGVQFDAAGNPVFYSQYGGSSNDLANIMQDLGPAGQIALAVATGGLTIPQQIAAQMAVQVLSGKDIGDAIKGAAINLAIAQIPGMDAMKDGAKYLNGIDDTGMLSKAFQTAATSASKAALTGGDISKALLTGAVSGGASGAIDLMAEEGVEGFKDLTKTQQKLVKNAISGVISGKPLDQVLINSAIAAANAEIYGSKKSNQDITKKLSDAGLMEETPTGLPQGIQTASADGETPFRVDMGSPTYAEDARAAALRPPAGYRVMSKAEQEDRLISEGEGDAPSKYETVRPAGAYYDATLNAWLAPSKEFEAATNVEDFSKYFEGTNLPDSELSKIVTGVRSGDIAADDLYWLTGESGNRLSDADIRDIVASIKTAPPATDAGVVEVTAPRPTSDDYGTIDVTDSRPTPEDYGTIDVTAPRPTSEDFGEIEVTAPRIPSDDYGTVEVKAPRPTPEDYGTVEVTAPRMPADDMGEIEITAPRPAPEDYGTIEVTAPRIPPDDMGEIEITDSRLPPEEAIAPPVVPPVTPPVVPPKPPVVPPVVPPEPPVVPPEPPVVPPKVSLPELMSMLNITPLYGGMDYYDPFGDPFAQTKMRPVSTTNRPDQTKMAQGGYLDDLLAENMSVDDLLKLLR